MTIAQNSNLNLAQPEPMPERDRDPALIAKASTLESNSNLSQP